MPPPSSYSSRSDRYKPKHPRSHRRTDSTYGLLNNSPQSQTNYDPPPPPPHIDDRYLRDSQGRRDNFRDRRDSRRSSHGRPRSHQTSSTSAGTDHTFQTLSADSLAQLNAYNEKHEPVDYDGPPPRREARRTLSPEREVFDEKQDHARTSYTRRQSHTRQEPEVDQEQYSEYRREKMERRRRRRETRDHNHYREQDHRRRRPRDMESYYREKDYRRRDSRYSRRRVSGPLMEEGRAKEGFFSRNIERVKEESGLREFLNRFNSRIGSTRASTAKDSDYGEKRRKRKHWCIGFSIFLLILIIVIGVAVGVSKHKHSGDGAGSQPSNSNLDSIDPNSIPASAKGTYYDPFTWYDTTDFNVTYTDETVGGLPIMGLNMTWDDTPRANPNVPPLNQPWTYGSMPIRGVNVGGWLSIEPFITPSLFNPYPLSDGIVDEWTLSQKLGDQAGKTIEKHYSDFVNEQTFADIQAAGFDHVRLCYSYWAITTYDGDPYVKMTSWRYLLRAIEWARKHGLRVNLDLHGLPGSQNGWNHSGRQGAIGWLNGTDGQLNADRSLDIHKQLTAFFAQPRYTNIITMYGLANEPRMIELDESKVLNWTQQATDIVRASGMPNSTIVVFGDGFLAIPNWKGKLQGIPGLLLDVHQYVIFNTQQIGLSHQYKVMFSCQGWAQQVAQSSSTSTGFGNFLSGEWSQADTDCATYVNNVGIGTRWEGTLDFNDPKKNVLTPSCPTHGDPACSCGPANADPSTYSDEYKQFLRMFAEGQMHSFETGWGWFYWTWDTENATQWSFKKGIAAGILPADVTNRDFYCNMTIPDFASLSLPETY